MRASNEGLLRLRVPRAQRSPLRPARLTRLHQATMFQLLFLSHSQAGMEEQPSTARVEGAAFPISSRAGFLVGLGQFEGKDQTGTRIKEPEGRGAAGRWTAIR